MYIAISARAYRSSQRFPHPRFPDDVPTASGAFTAAPGASGMAHVEASSDTSSPPSPPLTDEESSDTVPNHVETFSEIEGTLLDEIQTHVMVELRDAKQPHISWHSVLNNHASHRPIARGGPLCASLKACKEFGTFGSMHSCRITLPNSYAPGDGKMVEVESIAPDRRAAAEDAACAAFAVLCADRDGLHHVIFRRAHWQVPKEVLINTIARIVADPSAMFQPLTTISLPDQRTSRPDTRDPASGGEGSSPTQPLLPMAVPPEDTPSGAPPDGDMTIEEIMAAVQRPMPSAYDFVAAQQRGGFYRPGYPIVSPPLPETLAPGQRPLEVVPVVPMRELNDGDDRADLSDFWRLGPGRLWARPSSGDFWRVGPGRVWARPSSGVSSASPASSS